MLFLILLFFAFAALLSEALPKVKTSPDDAFFRDESGRVIIFHGGNRVKKSSPWYFENQVNTEDEYKMYKKLGFNVVRLGYMWSGIEPEENVYNQTYIDVVKNITDKFADAGVYTLLDLHEDILSSKFCLYDGAPLWLINKSKPKHEFPWPLKGGCEDRGWMKNALAQAPQTAYQDIYDNNYGMLDSLVDMWKHSATFFKGNKNIIGMEIMNEPFAGDTYSDPTLFLPGVAGKKNLARMNEAVAKGIREVDEDAIIFFEPVTWGMIFDGKISGSGYDQVPGGDEYKDRSVFSYHYYCNSFSPNWREYPNRQKFICDKTIGPLVFKAVKNDLKKFGGAAMMTEGMACDDDHQEECINVANMLDEHLFSFTDYGSSQGATLEPSEIQQATWARTYARATTGIPKKMKFDIDSDTKDFEYCYDLDTSIDGVTEVFASTIFHYTAKGGANVVVEGDVKQVESGDDDLLWFEKVDGAKHGSRVCITLTA